MRSIPVANVSGSREKVTGAEIGNASENRGFADDTCQSGVKCEM